MSTSTSGTGQGPVPGHVAWVASPAAAGASSPEKGASTSEKEEAALLSLVESAVGLGVGWLTLQEPSRGQALRERAGELAGRRVALSSVSPGGTFGLHDVVDVEAPALRVLLAEERSGRRELVAVVRELAARGVRPKDVSEATIGGALGVPDVDLLVLTGSDRRVPDLLVWQVAYSEIVVLGEPWPEVGAAQFAAAIAEYRRRDRRYGGLVASR